MAVKKQEVSLGEENWTMEIRPKASFFQFNLKEILEYRVDYTVC